MKPKYLHPIHLFAKPGSQQISDIRLSAALGNRDFPITLLEETVHGVKYYLRLIGKIEGEDDDGNKIDETNITESQIEALEHGIGNTKTLNHSPYFEWIDENGRPIGDMFSQLWLDAAIQKSYLLKTFYRSTASF